MAITNSKKDVFLAIDANAIIHRAFHAYPSTLQTEGGIQVNAVYGFTTMLLEALEMFDPKYVLCAMDTHKPTFRHAMYSEYKATRKSVDLSLIDQFPLVEEILKSFNIPVLKREGYEADDILGTISKYVSEGVWNSENIDLYILSGDRDLLQLINERTYVCLPNGNFKNIVIYDRQNTYDKFGYYPEQVVDYKGIVGDASDNIPGVKGVGDKTVLDLLSRFKSLNGIYENINEVEGRFKNLLVEGVEQAEFSRQLATIDKDVSVEIHLSDCILRDLDRRVLTSTFKKYAFKSLIRKLDDIFGKEEETTNSSQLGMFGSVSTQYEWSSEEDAVQAISEGKNITLGYINSEESYNGEPFFLLRVDGKDMLLKPFDIFKYLDSKRVLFYNFEELVTLFDIDISINYQNFFDVLLARHMLNSEKRDSHIKDLAFEYSSNILDDKVSPNFLNQSLDVLEETFEAQIEKINDLELYEYTREKIGECLDPKDTGHLISSLKKIEIPISIILAGMEKRGVGLDWDTVTKLRNDLDQEIGKISKEIYSIVGHEFNINSPKQLSDILYRELDLPNRSKGSTRESVLKEMKGMHPIIEHLLYFREITKIQSTYVEPLYQNSKKDNDGKYSVNTDFKQTGTTSGRFSSVNPNMQNLPLDGDWAKKVRECFVSRKGFSFLALDYSQMELRIMADISGDKLLTQDFVNDLDIHTATAARVLEKKMDDITSKERSIGKTVNFGMIFGQTPFGLSSLLGIDRDTAGGYIQAYFDHYKGVEEYMRKTEFEAFERGYVQSMFGTTRYVSGIRSRNQRSRAASAREAINMPIQGSEADIMKLIMIKISEYINQNIKEDAFLLLQIHDEIILEVRDNIVEKVSKDIKSIMLDTVKLSVPLDVHISVGKKLSDLK